MNQYLVRLGCLPNPSVFSLLFFGTISANAHNWTVFSPVRTFAAYLYRGSLTANLHLAVVLSTLGVVVKPLFNFLS